MKIGICKTVPEPFRSRFVAASIAHKQGNPGAYDADRLESSLKMINQVRKMAMQTFPELFVSKQEEEKRAKLIKLAELQADTSSANNVEEVKAIQHQAGLKALETYLRG